MSFHTTQKTKPKFVLQSPTQSDPCILLTCSLIIVPLTHLSQSFCPYCYFLNSPGMLPTSWSLYLLFPLPIRLFSNILLWLIPLLFQIFTQVPPPQTLLIPFSSFIYFISIYYHLTCYTFHLSVSLNQTVGTKGAGICLLYSMVYPYSLCLVHNWCSTNYWFLFIHWRDEWNHTDQVG